MLLFLDFKGGHGPARIACSGHSADLTLLSPISLCMLSLLQIIGRFKAAISRPMKFAINPYCTTTEQIFVHAHAQMKEFWYTAQCLRAATVPEY